MANAIKQEPSSPVNGVVTDTTFVLKKTTNEIAMEQNITKSNHNINGFAINKINANNGQVAGNSDGSGEDGHHIQSHCKEEKKSIEVKERKEERSSKKNNNAKANSLTYTSDDDVYYKPGGKSKKIQLQQIQLHPCVGFDPSSFNNHLLFSNFILCL